MQNTHKDQPTNLEPTDTVATEYAKSGQQIPLERGASISEREGTIEELETDQDPNNDLMNDSMIEADESPEGLDDDLDRDGGAYADESNMPQKVYSDREFNRLIDSDVHGDSPTAEDHDEVFPTD
jgi:hypothetical protein